MSKPAAKPPNNVETHPHAAQSSLNAAAAVMGANMVDYANRPSDRPERQQLETGEEPSCSHGRKTMAITDRTRGQQGRVLDQKPARTLTTAESIAYVSEPALALIRAAALAVRKRLRPPVCGKLRALKA